MKGISKSIKLYISCKLGFYYNKNIYYDILTTEKKSEDGGWYSNKNCNYYGAMTV